MQANVELVAVLKRGLQQITGHGGLSGLLKIFFSKKLKEAILILWVISSYPDKQAVTAGNHLETCSGLKSPGDFGHVKMRANDIRLGTLVGEDKYGNKYYEDNKQFFDKQVVTAGDHLETCSGLKSPGDIGHVKMRANVIRLDTLVGEYKYENKYYEENEQFFGSTHVEDSERTLKLIRGEIIAFSVTELWYKDSSIESRSEEGIGGFMVQFPGIAGPHDIFSSYFLLSKFFLS
ncbi:hypothetical protein STEG23_025223 [Scotinomys teguina]